MWTHVLRVCELIHCCVHVGICLGVRVPMEARGSGVTHDCELTGLGAGD